jgi:hypothetical protein
MKIHILKKTDLSGEYWEPFFDRLYKMGSMLGFTKKIKGNKNRLDETNIIFWCPVNRNN